MSLKHKFQKMHLKIKMDEEDEKNHKKLARDTNLIDSQSIEIGIDKVYFVKEKLLVENKGMKNHNNSQYLSNIDAKDLDICKSMLGKGASGFVHKAIHKPTGTVLALKSINIYDKEKRAQLKNDLKVLQNSNCPFLVKFYGAFFYDGTVKLALEYMDLGSLDKVIEKIKNIPPPSTPEPILAKIAQEILQGLLYLHKVKHQIHRDIKPGNILINSEGLVKLTDFGISRTVENTSGFSETFVGTKSYMSPERFKGDEYSFDSDIWSFGLILYELAMGTFPYDFSKVFIEHFVKIIDDPEPRFPNNGTFSKELCDFLEKCLQKDPKKRASVVELCAHPWILKYSDEEANITMWLADLFGFMVIDS